MVCKNSLLGIGFSTLFIFSIFGGRRRRTKSESNINYEIIRLRLQEIDRRNDLQIFSEFLPIIHGTGISRLMHSVLFSRQQIERIKLFLDEGADPNKQDSKGNTALILLAYYAKNCLNSSGYIKRRMTCDNNKVTQTGQLLLYYKADPTISNIQGNFPITYSSPELSRLLINYGSDCPPEKDQETQNHYNQHVQTIKENLEPYFISDLTAIILSYLYKNNR